MELHADCAGTVPGFREAIVGNSNDRQALAERLYSLMVGGIHAGLRAQIGARRAAKDNVMLLWMALAALPYQVLVQTASQDHIEQLGTAAQPQKWNAPIQGCGDNVLLG